MVSPSLVSTLLDAQRRANRWTAMNATKRPALSTKDETLCPCGEWHEFELTAAADAAERRLLSATTVKCGRCATATSITYCWRRQSVVAMRHYPPSPLKE